MSMICWSNNSLLLAYVLRNGHVPLLQHLDKTSWQNRKVLCLIYLSLSLRHLNPSNSHFTTTFWVRMRCSALRVASGRSPYFMQSKTRQSQKCQGWSTCKPRDVNTIQSEFSFSESPIPLGNFWFFNPSHSPIFVWTHWDWVTHRSPTVPQLIGWLKLL